MLMVAAANEIRVAELVSEENPEGQLAIRVGINVGPVSATIIGRQAQKFTLLGDAMNTASRMESTARPNVPQISSQFAALINYSTTAYRVVARSASVQVKGKGQMATFELMPVRVNPKPTPAVLPGNPITDYM